MTKLQNATDKRTPVKPAMGAADKGISTVENEGILRAETTETSVSVDFIAGIFTSFPLWSGAGEGFWFGSPSSMQGQDWESEQQQDCATAWHEELSAAATGMTWASWKTSPKIRAIANFMFLTTLRVMQQVFCSSLFYLLPAAAGIQNGALHACRHA